MKYIAKDGGVKEVADNYSMVAAMRGQEVLKYQEFGSYQGEWLLLARDADGYFIYKGCYGSCSGCDDIQLEFDSWNDEAYPWDKVENFLRRYPHFLYVRAWEFENLHKSKDLLAIFPANFRSNDEVSIEGFVAGISLAPKENK